MTEYVIRGNAAVLKCSIPSFVADFVRVESWIDDEGNVLSFSDNYGSMLRCSLNSYRHYLVYHPFHSQYFPLSHGLFIIFFDPKSFHSST